MMGSISGTLRLARAVPAPPPPPPPPSGDYIDIAQAADYKTRSHWKRPWRSRLDVPAALKFIQGLGINVNCKTSQLDSVCRLLAANGIKSARHEIGFSAVAYAEPPTDLSASSKPTHVAYLEAFKKWGIRPLILLNGNSGAPCPSTSLTLKLTKEAPIGATQIEVESTTGVVPLKSGITAFSAMSYYLFTEIPSAGKIKLSRPLKTALPAGTLKCDTLLYTPFRAPVTLEPVAANPAFEETMHGWQNYANIVSNLTKEILGNEEFDIEIWNEMSFGSAFTSINNYVPGLEPGEAVANSRILKAIAARTTSYLASRFPNIGINNGFSNTNFITPGGYAPGVTARSGHPYGGSGKLSSELTTETQTAVDALGEPNGSPVGGKWVEEFTPSYRLWMPELWLHCSTIECFDLNIAPFITKITSAINDGRNAPAQFPLPLDSSGGTEPSAYLGTTPVNGPPIETWITECNMGPTPEWVTGVTKADEDHLEAKICMRLASIYLNKGVTKLYLFGSGQGKNGELDIIRGTFWSQLAANPAVYPGDSSGGDTVSGLGRIVEAMEGATAIVKPKELTVTTVTDHGGLIQFEGKTGTKEEEERFPDLMNEDCLVIAPYQVNDSGKFVIALNVMTIDMSQEHEGGEQRFDLPPVKYTIGLGGIVGTNAKLVATDPITGKAVPVTKVSSTGAEVVFEMELTDSPRLLTIQE